MVKIPNQPRHNGPKRARMIIQYAILNRRKLKFQPSQIATVVESKDQFKSLNQKAIAATVVTQLLKKRFQAFLLKIKKTNKKIYAAEPPKKKQKRAARRQQEDGENDEGDEDDQQNTRSRKKNKPRAKVIDTANLLQRMLDQESSEDSRSSRQRDLRRNRKYNQDDSSKQASKKSNDDSLKNLPIEKMTSLDFQFANQASKPSNLQGTMTQQEWENTDYLQNQNYSQGLADQIDSSQTTSQSSQNNIISNFQQKKKIFDNSGQQEEGVKRTKRRRDNTGQQNLTNPKQKKKNMNITLDEQITLDDLRQMHNNTSILQMLDTSIQKMESSGGNLYYQIIPKLQLYDHEAILGNKILVQKLKQFAKEKGDHKRDHRTQVKNWQISNKKHGQMDHQNREIDNINYHDQDYGFNQKDIMIERPNQLSQLPQFFSDNPFTQNLFDTNDMHSQLFVEDGITKKKTQFSAKIEIRELARKENKRPGVLFKEMLLRAQKGDIQMSQQNPEKFGEIILTPL